MSLPDGFTCDVVASYRDPIGGGETFGYNNDFIAYFPLVDEHATGATPAGSPARAPESA